jgi:hypothetical protein
MHSSFHTKIPLRSLVLASALALIVSACGGFPTVDNPVGEPLLPDLVPEPPVDLRVTVEDGTTTVRFSSTLVNVGEGDFVLRANRDLFNEWSVEQELWYSESGGELISTEADMAWGGDGHDHWHVRRVASYRLVPLDEDGTPIEDGLFRIDSKIGFCFYDHTAQPGFDQGKAVYDVHECGDEDDEDIRMGLSPGWADIYDFTLPGQSVDITVLPDGNYRLWAEVDPKSWFTEETRDNNVTWIDFELFTQDGRRFARLTEVGPEPGD